MTQRTNFSIGSPSEDGRVDKIFQTLLVVPNVWEALLAIESFDDLTAFLQPTPPMEARGPGGLTLPDWVRPIRYDHREVSFTEDDYRVGLELLSGQENYYTLGMVVLPSGERYAHTEVSFQIRPLETLEIRGVGRFTWRQQVTGHPIAEVRDEPTAEN